MQMRGGAELNGYREKVKLLQLFGEGPIRGEASKACGVGSWGGEIPSLGKGNLLGQKRDPFVENTLKSARRIRGRGRKRHHWAISKRKSGFQKRSAIKCTKELTSLLCYKVAKSVEKRKMAETWRNKREEKKRKGRFRFLA